MVGLLVAGATTVNSVRGAARLDPRRLPATTQPLAGKFPLPPSLAILGQRSLFSRNGAPASGPEAVPVKPEALMALRGLAVDESNFIAFIEDTISHRTLTLHAGDGVAGGHIQALTMDELAFELGSNVVHIRVGQNLLGGMMPVAMAPPPPMPAAGPPSGAAGLPPGALPPGAGPVMEGRPGGPGPSNGARPAPVPG